MRDIYLICGGRHPALPIAVRVEAVEAADPMLEARGCWGPVSCVAHQLRMWVTIVVLSLSWQYSLIIDNLDILTPWQWWWSQL